MSEEAFEGIAREKMPWNPMTDYHKCVTCGKCVDYCHMGAFSVEKKDGQKRTIVNPNKCIVLCRGCEDICLANAITHPSEEETQKIIDELKMAKLQKALRNRNPRANEKGEQSYQTIQIYGSR